jgi:hypothetical protein
MYPVIVLSSILVFINLVVTECGTTITVNCYVPSKEEVTGLFTLWSNALATLNSNIVTNRYTDTAVLLATVSDTPRNTPALIKSYFDTFLLKKPQGVIKYSDPEPGCNMATDMGVYEFTFRATGQKVVARYTFSYVYNPITKEWKIQHHHSSMLPEQFLPVKAGDVKKNKNLKLKKNKSKIKPKFQHKHKVQKKPHIQNTNDM